MTWVILILVSAVVLGLIGLRRFKLHRALTEARMAPPERIALEIRLPFDIDNSEAVTEGLLDSLEVYCQTEAGDELSNRLKSRGVISLVQFLDKPYKNGEARLRFYIECDPDIDIDELESTIQTAFGRQASLYEVASEDYPPHRLITALQESQRAAELASNAA